MYLFNYFTQTGILTTIYRIAIQQKGTFHLNVVNFLDFISLLVVFLSALYFLRLQLSFPLLYFTCLAIITLYFLFLTTATSSFFPASLLSSVLIIALFFVLIFVLFFCPAALLCSLSSLTLFSPPPIQPYPRSHLCTQLDRRHITIKNKKGLHEWKPFLFRV